MKSVFYRFQFFAILIGGLLSACMGGFDFAHAASTQWLELGGGKARLIARKDPESGRIDGYVEVRLDKGWKTYWKSPGGSGIAPEFDFSGSRDFFVERVSFPAPEWIKLPDAAFYGYRGSVSFPFSGMANHHNASISLDMLIGVCEEICIPATAKFEIKPEELNRSDPRAEVGIALVKSRLPSAPTDNFKFNSLTLDGMTLRATGIAEGKAPFKAVISLPGIWVSDPKAADRMDGNSFAIDFPVPEIVFQQWDRKMPAQYTLLEHAGGNGSVSRAINGVIPLRKPVE